MIYDLGGVHTLRLLEMRILKAFHDMKHFLFFSSGVYGRSESIDFYDTLWKEERRSICSGTQKHLRIYRFQERAGQE